MTLWLLLFRFWQDIENNMGKKCFLIICTCTNILILSAASFTSARLASTVSYFVIKLLQVAKGEAQLLCILLRSCDLLTPVVFLHTVPVLWNITNKANNKIISFSALYHVFSIDHSGYSGRDYENISIHFSMTHSSYEWVTSTIKITENYWVLCS